MKKSFSFLVLFLVLLSGASAQKNVQKSDATATRDEITGDLKFGTGRTGTFLTGAALTLNSGSTLTLNGALAGTPTGGTLSLANLTLTLPATVSGGGSSFQPIDSDLTAIAALTTTANGRGLLTASALTAAGLGLTNGATLDTIGAKTQAGTGNLVLATSPTLVTPVLGAASATSLTIPGTGTTFLTFNRTDSATPNGGLVWQGTSGTSGARWGQLVDSGAAGAWSLQYVGTGAFANSLGHLSVTTAGQVGVNTNITSTNTTSGSLVVAGGVGVAGAAYFGGAINGTSFVMSSGGSFGADVSIAAGNVLKSTGDLYLQSAAATNVYLRPGGTAALTLAPTTLAATFAGAVTGNGAYTSTTNAGLNITGTNIPAITLQSSHASGRNYFLGSNYSANGILTLSGSTTAGGASTAILANFDSTNLTATFLAQLIAKGTATNDSAAAGYIGEYIENSTANTSGSAVSLTTNTNANVSSISLTAGDWDVSCALSFLIGGGSATAIVAGITQTSATPGGTGSFAAFTGTIAQTTYADTTLCVPVYRVKLAGTTTVYLLGRATFPGTCSAYGLISARRVR